MNWLERTVLRFYGAATTLLQPLVKRRSLQRAEAEPLYSKRLDERFGRYDGEVLAAIQNWRGQRPLWVHAVSLGETRAATELLAAYVINKRTSEQKAQKNSEKPAKLPLLLTHGTATGREAGAQWLAKHADDLGIAAVQVWQPWDSPGAVSRFLDAFQPQRLWLMETEIWPMLVHATRAVGIDVELVNARLSAKSLDQARRLRWLARPAYAALSGALSQTAEDAERLKALGVNVRAITGNLKFDANPDAKLIALGRAWRDAAPQLRGRPILAFASSREGEESEFLKAFASLVQVKSASDAIEKEATHPLLLIIPRHPQRFDAVADLAAQRGFTVSRRSAWADGVPDQAACEADVWIGDSLGEMTAYASAAVVALLGGSFAPLGGQNLIELLACGCPVVMGPHTFNFADAAERAEEAGCAQRVPGMAEGVSSALALLASATDQQRRSHLAQSFVVANSGALQRTVAALSAEG